MQQRQVVLSLLTDNKESDGEVFAEMAEHLPDTVERAYGDGAYDKSPCYKKCYEQGIQPIFPLKKGQYCMILRKSHG